MPRSRQPSPPSTTALPTLALLANALFWGLSWLPFRALAGLGLHSLWATTWVSAVAATLVVARNPGSVAQLLRNPGLVALALAAGLTNACFNWGITIGQVVRVVLLFYLMPVWAALAGRWLLRERIGPAAAARIALALAGAGIVTWRPEAGLPLPESLADWLGFAGGVAFALTNVLLRRQAADATSARALAMAGGAVVVPGLLALVLAAAGAPGLDWPRIDARVTVYATLTGGFFLCANLCQQYGAARLPAAVTAVVMLSEVVFAALSAALLGGEPLEWRTLAGGAMIVAASALAALPARKGAPA